MIKAIIFDFFGVLTQEGVSSFKKYYLEKTGDKEGLKKVEQLVEQLNMADIKFADFEKQLARLMGKDEQTVKQDLRQNRPNTELLNYIRRELKSKYKIGLISNSGDDWLFEILDQKDVELFDDIVLSHSEGVAKPEPAIYEKSLANLGVRAEGSVFIDDIARYVDAAIGLGMKAILYKDFPQMKRDLERILGNSPN